MTEIRRIYCIAQCHEEGVATLTGKGRTCRVPSGWQQAAGGVPKRKDDPIPGRCPKHAATAPREPLPVSDSAPDWEGKCEVCGASPVVQEVGMCGPCTFGEAETAGGNW